MSFNHKQMRADSGTNVAGTAVPLSSSIPSRAQREAQARQASASKKHVPTGVKVGLICAAIPLAIYFGGVALWGQVFMPNSYVNGQSVSMKTVNSVYEQIASSVSARTVTVSNGSTSFDVKASDIDFTADTNAIHQAIYSSVNPWIWPVKLLEGTSINVNVATTYSDDKLNDLVNKELETLNAGATQSEDASITYDANSTSFVIKPEVMGTEIDANKLKDIITAALESNVKTTDLSNAVSSPAVTKDDANLKTAVDNANAYLKATQALTANGTTVYTVSSADIAQWVTLNSDLSVSVNTDAVSDWATNTLSKTTDTAGSSRSFTGDDGSTISVSGGSYGWIADSSALAQKIADAIQSKAAGSIEIPWKQSASTWNPGGNEWGKRYIDVNLTTQHVTMYDESGNVVLSTDVVTGNTSKGYNTPDGVYTLNSNRGTNQTLVGLDENHDGEPDYKSNVSYWMPFIGNLYAFHDASWRSKFGGTIYETNGSHGCVNMPSDQAAKLYSLTKVGDVVVVQH